MRLTEQQTKTYRRDGVLPVGRVLDDAQLKGARDRLNAMREQDLLDKPESERGKYMLRRLNVSATEPWFGSLVRSPAILDLAESVLGPNLQYYQDNIFFKPASVGGSTPWHQDNVWWNASPPNMLTLWIALDDVDDDNGAVQYVKGSHSHLMDHTMPANDPNGGAYNLIDPKSVDADMLDRVVSFKVPAGHGVLHHCLTLHSAPVNASARDRRAYTITLSQAGLTSRDTQAFPLLRGRLPAA